MADGRARLLLSWWALLHALDPSTFYLDCGHPES